MFSKWTTYLVKRYLRKHDKTSGRRELVPFKKVSRIGIVYRAGVPIDEKHRKQIESEFEKAGKRVMTLGFVDHKEVGTEYQPNVHHDYFARKDLSRLKLPRKTSVMRFVTEPFDYLIYCSEEVSIPLLGITALSRAKCRVGPYFEDLEFGFDLLLKTEGSDSAYADQVIECIKKFDNG